MKDLQKGWHYHKADPDCDPDLICSGCQQVIDGQRKAHWLYNTGVDLEPYEFACSRECKTVIELAQ